MRTDDSIGESSGHHPDTRPPFPAFGANKNRNKRRYEKVPHRVANHPSETPPLK